MNKNKISLDNNSTGMHKKIQSNNPYSNWFCTCILTRRKNITVLPKEISQKNIPKNLLEDRELAYRNSIKSHEYNKKLFDKNKNEGEFKEGDSVFVENGNKLNRRKLEELRIGPYKILEKVSKSLYKVDTGHRKSDATLFHITKLTPAPPAPIQIEDIQGTWLLCSQKILVVELPRGGEM